MQIYFIIFSFLSLTHHGEMIVWRFLLPADHRIGGFICPSPTTWSPRLYIVIIYLWFFLLYTVPFQKYCRNLHDWSYAIIMYTAHWGNVECCARKNVLIQPARVISPETQICVHNLTYFFPSSYLQYFLTLLYLSFNSVSVFEK